MRVDPDQRWNLQRHGAAVLPLLVFFAHVAVPASPVLALTLANWGAPATARTHPIEDPGGKALAGFYQALSQTLACADQGQPAAVTRIVHYGDSHVAADLLTGALRSDFQRDFGEAGPGFILAGRPWSWYSRAGVESSASPGWRVNGLGQSALASDGRFGLAGVSLTTDRAGESIWLRAECQRFTFYLLKQPEGGTVTVWLDGASVLPQVSLDSSGVETAYLEVAAGGGGPHSLELRTVAPGRVRVFGIVAERSQAGVVYDALGINGARASRPLGWDWQLLASQLERRDPDLIIVAYGSNEVSDADLDLAEYRRNFSDLLRRFHRAAPRASLLVIAPPDRVVREGRRWRSLGAMKGLVEAQRQAAFSAGAAFWDLFQAMGAEGSIQRWATQPEPLAQPDRVHLTRQGYRLVAEMLYRELVRGYFNFLWEQLQPELSWRLCC